MKKIIAAFVVLVPVAALAHHGWGGYDSSNLLKLYKFGLIEVKRDP